MHRSSREPPVNDEEWKAIVQGVIELAKAKKLTSRTVAQSVPAEVAFGLVAIYVGGDPKASLQAPRPTREDVDFLYPLPMRTQGNIIDSVNFLKELISGQIKQGRLAVILPEGHSKVKRGQIASYMLRVSTT